MKKNNRIDIQINAGSMADIAFLLLIFFLVCTTIETEIGIKTILPRWEPLKIPVSKNQNEILKIQINANNEYLVQDESVTISNFESVVKNKINTFYKGQKKSKMKIDFTFHKNSSYQAYINVYSSLKSSYKSLWEKTAKEKHQKPYSSLSKELQFQIEKQTPLLISEQESENH